MGNLLILIGGILILTGLLINLFPNFPLLPGDILIQKDNFTFYFPIVTSLVVSLILTIIFNLLR